MTPCLLDAPPKRRTSYWAAVFTTGAHVVVGLAIAAVVVEPALVKQAVAMADFIEIEAPQPPPEPAPPPEPEPEVIQKRVAVAATPKPVPPTPDPQPELTPAPPAAAQAAQALTQEDVVDLSSSIVVGSGSKFAGGNTDPAGTSTRAVRTAGARGVGGGVTPGGIPAVQAPPVNRARAPRLAGGASWSCPFPPEADVAGVNQASVSLRVSVGATGSVSGVQVTAEPGYGFGRAAKRCAMNKRWDPGLDASGRVVDATAVVNVRFVR